MKRIGLTATAVYCVALVSGCAGVSVVPVGENQTPESKANGVRFYQEAPFLFVYPDGKGGIAAEVKWLPDTRQTLSARPYSFLAKNDTTLEFTASTLKSATMTVDETAVVKASLTALGKVLAATVANTKGGSNEISVPAPRLYRIVVDDDNNTLGLEGGDVLDGAGQPMVIKLTVAGE